MILFFTCHIIMGKCVKMIGIRKCEIMKKIFDMVLLTFTLALLTGPTFACATDINNVATGGACSISELNNMTKSNTVKEKVNISEERDLRPIRIKDKIEYVNPECLFGPCLQKMFNKPINIK